MSDLRRAAQAVIQAWDDPAGTTGVCRALDVLRAALAEQPTPVFDQRKPLTEAVRARIMREAYDYADEGWVEAYNGVKVMCTDVLDIICAHGIGSKDE